MAAATLVLAIVGTVSGMAALGWQVLTWRASGPVVEVKVVQSFPTYGDRLGELLTTVCAINKGRAPVTVTTWGLRLPDKQTMYIPEPFPGSDRLPFRLDQGASGNWHVATAAVAEACKAQGVSYTDLRGYVALGNGRKIEARKKGILLAEGFDIVKANSKVDST